MEGIELGFTDLSSAPPTNTQNTNQYPANTNNYTNSRLERYNNYRYR